MHSQYSKVELIEFMHFHFGIKCSRPRHCGIMSAETDDKREQIRILRSKLLAALELLERIEEEMLERQRNGRSGRMRSSERERRPHRSAGRPSDVGTQNIMNFLIALE